MRTLLHPVPGLLVTAVLLAGCGSSDDGSEGDTAPIVEDAVSEDIEGVTEDPEGGY